MMRFHILVTLITDTMGEVTYRAERLRFVCLEIMISRILPHLLVHRWKIITIAVALPALRAHAITFLVNLAAAIGAHPLLAPAPHQAALIAVSSLFCFALLLRTLIFLPTALTLYLPWDITKSSTLRTKTAIQPVVIAHHPSISMRLEILCSALLTTALAITLPAAVPLAKMPGTAAACSCFHWYVFLSRPISNNHDHPIGLALESAQAGNRGVGYGSSDPYTDG
jgi:hypothetical protein